MFPKWVWLVLTIWAGTATIVYAQAHLLGWTMFGIVVTGFDLFMFLNR